MAYANLPWLSIGPESFLAALDRGTQAGLERARLSLAADNARPRGGGMGAIRRSPFDPLREAQTENIREETRRENAEFSGEQSASAENQRLISIGVPADEAAAQSGFNRYMKPSGVSIPWQTMNLGGGEVVRVNRNTGEVDTVQEPRPKVDPVKMETLKSLRREAMSLQRQLSNPMTAILSGDQIRQEMAAKEAEIAALEQELGAGITATGANAPSPFAPAPFSAPSNDPLGLFSK